jgi:hypothetical protein
MATLTGYAVKISWLGADHTYVLSSEGHKWGCWGRDAGGKAICSGNGSASVANCISQPKSTSGLIYAVTGVCHQTANRILYPARAIVSRARGYWASSLVYGTYGTDGLAWIIRRTACGMAKGAETSAATGRSAGLSTARGEVGYLKAIDALYTTAAKKAASPLALGRALAKPSNLVLMETDITVAYRLGKDARPTSVSGVKKMQKALFANKVTLDGKYNNNQISKKKYADRVNDLVKKMLDRAEKELGAEQFTRIFGLERGERIGLVDKASL